MNRKLFIWVVNIEIYHTVASILYKLTNARAHRRAASAASGPSRGARCWPSPVRIALAIYLDNCQPTTLIKVVPLIFLLVE